MVPHALDRRFEAVIFDWDGTGVPHRGAEAAQIRLLVEELCSNGMEIAVVSGTDVAGLDGELRARPEGPGRLHLLVNGGSEVFVVDRDGVRRYGETGVTDTSGSTAWMLDELARRGIAPGLVLVAEDGTGPGGGVAVPVHEVLEDQLRRRREGDVPDIDGDPAWTLRIDGADATLARVHETLLTLGSGRMGSSGSLLVARPGDAPRVLVAGHYRGEGPQTELLACPSWQTVPGEADLELEAHRALDLRTGVLRQDIRSPGGSVTAAQFASKVRPFMVALRADGASALLPEAPPLSAPGGEPVVEEGSDEGTAWQCIHAGKGGVAAAARDRRHDSGPGRRRLERLAAYVADASEDPDPADAVRLLGSAAEMGFERLLVEHRQEWARRWERADVRVDGDDDLQLAIRFALFHLMGSVGDDGEAALGARGLSGSAYRGHVFWDSDVFVLPFFAATHPESARAMLEYRIRRLPEALASARSLGRKGARFPWESAAEGSDVTPGSVVDWKGQRVRILTGDLEDHVVADVAWAASCYGDWTGDEEFVRGPGRRLLVETARFWASRIRHDSQGRGHIYGVIGPDEYHESVDDNAYTNGMARWNLRAAEAVARLHPDGLREAEIERWESLADALVDGYDPERGIYEQFDGFFDLLPIIIADIAPKRPVAADVWLGPEVVRGSQVIKQADVLMLHHMLPEEVPPGSLEPNLRFYETRTAHGSSLSPGIHAGLLARAGRMDEALEALRLTSRMDLDDLTGSTSGGLHMATMGSLWQALVFGFAGIRPSGDALGVDPVLPPSWRSLVVPLCFRGSAVRVRVDRESIFVTASPGARVSVRGQAPVQVGPGGIRVPFGRARDKEA